MSKAKAPAAILAVLTAGAALVAQPANAAIMLLTRTMTIDAVLDGSDPFMDDRLQGKQFVMTVKYDTSKATTVPNPPGQSPTAVLEPLSGMNPILEVTYAFDDRTFTLGGDATSNLYFQNFQFPDDQRGSHYIHLDGQSANGSLAFGADLGASFPLGSGLPPLSFDTPYFTEADNSGSFAFSFTDENNVVTTGLLDLEGDLAGIDGSIRVERLDVAAVPEPATWALMIAGSGLTGATLRLRRRAFAVA